MVAALAKEAVAPLFKNTQEHGTAMPLVVFPAINRVSSLETYLPKPVRKRGAALVKDTNSFIHYVQLHQEPGTLLFGDLDTTGASITAILDYHLSNAGPDKPDFVPGTAGWGEHICKLVMEHSPEWKVWAAHNEHLFTQTEFALFLEDNRLDIVSPEAGEVIDIAKCLEATTGSQFKSAIRLDNGDRKFKYETQTTARAGETGALTIPEKIKLKLPVFINGPAFEIEAFFRYRLKSDGSLVLFYALIRPHKVIELAVETARMAVEASTKLLVLYGSAKTCNPT